MSLHEASATAVSLHCLCSLFTYTAFHMTFSTIPSNLHVCRRSVVNDKTRANVIWALGDADASWAAAVDCMSHTVSAAAAASVTCFTVVMTLFVHATSFPHFTPSLFPHPLSCLRSQCDPYSRQNAANWLDDAIWSSYRSQTAHTRHNWILLGNNLGIAITNTRPTGGLLYMGQACQRYPQQIYSILSLSLSLQ